MQAVNRMSWSMFPLWYLSSSLWEHSVDHTTHFATREVENTRNTTQNVPRGCIGSMNPSMSTSRVLRVFLMQLFSRLRAPYNPKPYH